MPESPIDRRRLVATGLIGGMIAVGGLASCRNQRPHQPGKTSPDRGSEEGEEAISAVEDLMREHGVLRRILIVYVETASRLANGAAGVDAGALREAAVLFRAFGEDYHERNLEERFLFPELRCSNGDAGELVDVLLVQHRRGRELTGYIHETVRGGSIPTGAARPLARALTAMNRMYEAHAAWEDTVIFPAWKKSIEPDRMRELAETFEDIEHRQFGKDGFNDAVQRIGSIERRLGIGGLPGFTAAR